MLPEKLYEKMILIRESEERIRREYSKDEMKTPVHLGIGSEAISVGVVAGLNSQSVSYYGTYRNHALFLSLETSLQEFFGELYGKVTGCGKGKAGSMHLTAPDAGLMMTSAVVATTIPLAVGHALANKYKQNRELVAVFFGDGACEEGVFHESLNFAALHNLNILFVCEDNHLAIHNPVQSRQRFNLQNLIQAYGIVYRSVFADSLDEVIRLTKSLEVLLHHRPCFLNAKYHRFLEHVGPNEDYDVGYRGRPPPESSWDPVKNLDNQKSVISLSSERRKEIRDSVAAQIESAVLNAKEASFPELLELTKDVYEI